MTSGQQLKSAIIGLVGFAATQEQVLLAIAPADEEGSALRWAALPLIAHNTEFRHQQAERLRAIRLGYEPQEFAEVDHGSESLYRGDAAQAADQVAAQSNQVAGELIDAVRQASADDLCDPSRHPWLRGRQLWLQIVVRGFWHPTGHLADYFVASEQPGRAVAMAAHAVATASYLKAPDPARGMAAYNLACAQARAGQHDEAAVTASDAISLNPDLRAKVATEPDLAVLRATGRLPGES